MGKIEKYVKDPWKVIVFLKNHRLLSWMSDESYLRLTYRAAFHKKLNLEHPQTYSEKLQWLKLYNRIPEYTQYVDKYAVHDFVKERIGEEYLIPLLGVWDSYKEIDFGSLPDKFVLKCTHDSGGLVICRDKSALNKKAVRKKLEKCLRTNYYLYSREWPYKDVKPRIIAEPYLVDESGTQLKDYKFFCFDGKVKAMFIATDRGTDTRFDFYDEKFNHFPMTNGHPNADIPPKKPDRFEKMKQLAEKISVGMPHARIDFYDCKGKVYFGEITLFHWSGLVPFEPEEYDKKFGDWIRLPDKTV